MEKTDRYRLYERLARRYHAGIYSYLRWLSGKAELAEDLTQETFVRLWQCPPEFRGEPALKAWVYKVARNEYLQYQRKAGIQTIALDDIDAVEAVGVDDARAGFERAENAGTIRKAVNHLPQIYREVVVLHNLESLSLNQVAEVLGVPLGTVKSRRAKAFEMLRQMLAAEVKCYEM